MSKTILFEEFFMFGPAPGPCFDAAAAFPQRLLAQPGAVSFFLVEVSHGKH